MRDTGQRKNREESEGSRERERVRSFIMHVHATLI